MQALRRNHYDVTIVGAGLAGLTLARHLALDTNKTVLLVDRREQVPGASQKVGESLVQLSGYYLAKVLDLEEYLLRNHYLKYNLRFHWATEGRENRSLEEYSRSFIRLGSNIPTFQLDRNTFEEHLLECVKEHERSEFAGGIRDLAVTIAEDDSHHQVSLGGQTVTSRWVVDASGRGGFLKRKLGLEQKNVIRHGSTWCWVDGLVNIEKLTDRSLTEVRVDRQRMMTGHMPSFLSTNHFCAEGMWFWVIPLHGKTSLGLVYDKAVVDSDSVATAKKLLDFVCKKWPVFERDLPHRKVLDEGRYYDFSYDCKQTISPQRWAMTGEAGRFSDPLYSPGSDLISIYNTLIVDAIKTEEGEALAAKCRPYEWVMRAMYEAYIPSYSTSYDCLGDRQCFTYKYGWELAVYFGFYVLPFINDLFTNQRFVPIFLRKFGLLGPMNRNLQRFLSGFYQWKKQNLPRETKPMLNDFYEAPWLRNSELLFYKVGLTVEEAEEVLEKQFMAVRDYARWIVAQVYATVLGRPEIGEDRAFMERIRTRALEFNPEKMQADYENARMTKEVVTV